ncbi:hypothetical protein PT974_05413 [Cladobotryum mycophilum]|uniref:Aminoglycoside phosphotransferase domain-containing protein n=1 Tax=Cladobotryum mycophilum TaxID=491253 RepID=A0ABR0SIP9_9HYPO
MATVQESDGAKLLTWKTFERCVAIYHDKVVKRELSNDELIHRPNGAIIFPFWAKERLQNEAATLEFVAKNSSIPVPKCRLYTENGLLHLETEKVTDGVILDEIEEASREAAVAAVAEQMESDILPQLRSLRRNFIGSVDPNIPVFPPQRVYRLDRRSWERITSEADDFALIHNDLGPQNIFICPKTFRIVSIVDWEFAGFFPDYYELPLWTTFGPIKRNKLCEGAFERELGFFGLAESDLKNYIPPP